MTQQVLKNNNQVHSGNGDNVLGDKNVTLGLLPENFKSLHKKIFQLISKGDKEQALASIETAECLDSNGNNRIYYEAVKIFLGAVEKGKESKVSSELVDRISTSKNDEEKDLFLSSLIRIKLLVDGKDVAREIYLEYAYDGVATIGLFLESLATNDEINDFINSEVVNKILYKSAVVGFIRNGKPQVASELIPKVKSYHSKEEGIVLDLLIRAIQLTNKIQESNYYLANQDLKRDLDELKKEVESLITINDDARLFSIIIPLYQILDTHDNAIEEICWQSREKWKVNYPDYYKRLKANRTGSLDGIDPTTRRALEVSQSSAQKEILKSRIVNQSSTVQEVFLALVFCDIEIFSEVDVESFSIENDSEENLDSSVSFLKAILVALSKKYNHLTKEEKISFFFNEAISKEFELKDLNPVVVLKFASALNYSEMYSLNVNLLKKFIPNNPWFSPVVAEFALSLLNSRQYQTLHQLLNDTYPTGQYDSRYWGLKTHINLLRSEYKKAKICSERFLKLNPASSQAIYYYALTILKIGEDPTNFLCNLDYSFLTYEDQYSVSILEMASTYINNEQFEDIIIGFFIRSPVKHSVTVTKVLFEQIIRKTVPQEELDCSEASKKNVFGLSYEENKKIKTILVVPGTVEISDNTYIQTIDSPKIKSLLTLKEGESTDFGFVTLKLIEKMSAVTACFRIATQIRSEVNDGNDPFWVLEAPSQPDELVDFFKEKLSRDQSQAIRDLYKNDNAPLLMKGKQINEEVSGLKAFQMFTSSEITKPRLVSLDDDTQFKNKKIIADAYTIVYFSLIGLEDILFESRVHITHGTRNSLEKTYKSLTSEFLRMGVDDRGDLVKTTEEDVKNSFEYFTEALKSLFDGLELIQEIDLYSGDIPVNLNKLEDIVDADVLNTIAVCSTTQSVWLTVDDLLATLISEDGILCKRAEKVVSEQAYKISYIKRRPGIQLFAFDAVRVPVFESDIEELFKIKNNDDLIVLRRVMMKIGNVVAQHQSFSARFHLMPILVQTKLADPNNKLNRFLAESLINLFLRAQVFAQDEMTCEFRLANSYFKVQMFLQKNNLKMPPALYYYERFAQGHFMDIDSINKYLREFAEKSGV